ncbi:MAG: cation diffusion facilitator family transporter [Methanomassiliicoccales archaeon]
MDKKQIAMLAIFGGVFIFLLKLSAYFASNSVALLSDALESIINIVASIMMFAALGIASKAEDENHKYGHQKAENISALVEGVLIIIAAVLIIEATVGRILNPVGFEDVNLGIIISLCATSLNGLLAIVMLRESKKSQSMALEGDAKHLFSDVMSSVGVVIGLFIANVTGLYILDPLIALVVAVLLIKMGISVFRRTTHDLMDSTCEEEEKAIVAVLDRKDGFLEYQGLKTRRSGNQIFMEVHIRMAGKVSLSDANELSAKIEKQIGLAVPGIVANIHVEDQS